MPCRGGRGAGSRRPGGATPASWPGDTQLRVRAAVSPKQAVMLLGLLVLQGPLVTPLVGITRAVISPLRQGTRVGLKRQWLIRFMKAGRLLCCKSEMLRVSAGLLSRAAASQLLRSSGLRGRFVGAREAASSVHALVCPPQAPLRADPLLSCGPRNRQRTAAGQRAGSAPEQGMWLAGATSFRRALGPWGPGEEPAAGAAQLAAGADQRDPPR